MIVSRNIVTEVIMSPKEGTAPSIRGESDSEGRLRSFAVLLGYGGECGFGSLRRLEPHARRAKAPWVLGIRPDSEGQLVCDGDAGEMIGPIPDAPTSYLLPRGTRAIDYGIVPGAVSGRCFCFQLRTDVKRPYVVLATEQGYSGAFYKVVAES